MKLSEAKKKAEEFVKAKKYDKAIELYEKIVAALEKAGKPVDVQIYNTLGDLYYRVGQKDAAIINIRKAMDMYREEGIIQQAAAMGKRILRIDPDNKEILGELGAIYKEKGIVTEAFSYYRQYIDYLLSRGEKEKAIRAYEELISIPTVSLNDYKGLVDLYVETGKIELAKKKLTDLYMKAEENNDEEIIDYIKTMQNKLGISIIKEEDDTIEIDSDNEDIDVSDSESVTAEETAETEDSFSMDELESVELSEVESGSLEGMEAFSFSEDLSSQTDFAKEYIDMAQMSLQLGEKEEAIADFLRAAQIYIEEDKLSEAKDVLDTILKEDPQNEEAITSLIEVCFKQKDRECVIDAYLSLSDIYADEDKEHAEKILTKGLEIFPNEERLKKKLNEIKGVEQDTVESFANNFVNELMEETKEDTVLTANDIMAGKDEGGMKFTVSDNDEIAEDENFFSMDEIIAEFKQGLKNNISEDDVDTHYDMGLTFKEMGMMDEAIEEFKIALKSPRTELKALGMLAQCYNDMGDKEKAYRMIIRGLKLPKYSEQDKIGLYYQLAKMYEEDNRLKEALVVYKRILKIDKSFHDVLERAKLILEMIKRGGVPQQEHKKEEPVKVNNARVKKQASDDDDDLDIGNISYM